MSRIFVVVLLLMLNVVLFAQTPAISVGNSTGIAGLTATVSINLTSGTIGISTLQFDLIPANEISAINPVVITTGVAATIANKSASANVLPNGNVRVLIFGLNQTIIGSGGLAVVQFNIASNATSGSHTIGITGIVSSDSNGNNVPTTGVTGSITVVAKPTAPIKLKVI